jgi:predicted dehydrogenase
VALEEIWRVGLLGAGYIAGIHARALRARRDVQVVAVCDRSLPRAQALAAGFHGCAAVGTLERLLATQAEVVHVLLPPEAHAEAALRILAAGRHVLLEKPMAPDAAACRALVEAARSRGLRLGVSHNFLFTRAAQRLRAWASDGTLGRLDSLSIDWLYPLAALRSGPFDQWMLRQPGNLLLELAPHPVAFLLDLAGSIAQPRVSASRPLDLPGGARVYRHWQVLGHARDTAVSLTLSVTPGPAVRSIVARGSAGAARCHFDRDLCVIGAPVGHGAIDNLASGWVEAWQLGWQAARNFARAAAGTLGQSPAADPFAESVARSVSAWYDSLAGEPDPRLDGEFGARVMAECEHLRDSLPAGALEVQARARPVAATPSSPKVLVVGGTGFIGSHLVRELAGRGVGVRVATRDAKAARAMLEGAPVELAEGDLRDAAFVDRALQGIETVYYLARAHGSTWEDYRRNDVEVTRSFAERSLAARVRRFIYTGTIDSCHSARPGDVIRGDTPLDPAIGRRNLYARSKAACEALLRELHRERKLPLVVFRPGIVVGRGSPPAHWGVGMFLSDVRVRTWGAGTHALPLVLVQDVVDALILALDRPDIEGRTFLLTDPAGVSARDYLRAVEEGSGTRLRVSPTPIWQFYLWDALKEGVKHLIRHPRRRRPSYRDWASRAHRARYDSSATIEALGWRPAGGRERLLELGAREPARELYR